MKTLESFTKELVLLSKGWYGEGDRLLRARILVALIVGVSGMVSVGELWNVLVNALFEVYEDRPDKLCSYIKDLFRWSGSTLTTEDACLNLMGKLSILQVKEGTEYIIDIGEPNEDYLKRLEERLATINEGK